jgi:hypothetical protein
LSQKLSVRPQTYALDRAATGVGTLLSTPLNKQWTIKQKKAVSEMTIGLMVMQQLKNSLSLHAPLATGRVDVGFWLLFAR